MLVSIQYARQYSLVGACGTGFMIGWFLSDKVYDWLVLVRGKASHYDWLIPVGQCLWLVGACQREGLILVNDWWRWISIHHGDVQYLDYWQYSGCSCLCVNPCDASNRSKDKLGYLLLLNWQISTVENNIQTQWVTENSEEICKSNTHINKPAVKGQNK